MSAFDYPITPHTRKHGPVGYATYAAYRPWLRDDFTLRCVYCLAREQWGRVTGEFGVDHFQPQARSPQQALDYENLLYCCQSCNLHKSSNVAGYDPQPGDLTELFHPRRHRWDEHFEWRGLLLLGKTAIGRTTVEVLRLNSEDRLERRRACRD
ncbi:MAG: HNH endonuclease [Pirellulaceae bacterium]|nr:HNH endonuclease [Pirellulaceae bacterium]